LTTLSDFTIPAGLLTLLGLSQAAYVTGKTVTPKIPELNERIEAAIKAEDDFRTAVD